jgi:transcriptional regulator with XRE-family HTH domain
MKERLLKFLEEESLTAAKFADEIGVQRSSISHILSGRNNPGYDFFQKVLKRYSHLNAEWLLTGSGKMTKTAKQTSLFTVDNEVNNETDEKSAFSAQIETILPKNEQSSLPKETVQNLSPENKETIGSKRIDKIVILYSDHSFREYVPSK